MKVKTLPLAFPAQPFRYIKKNSDYAGRREPPGGTGAPSTVHFWRCPEVGPRTSIGTPPRRKSQADLWTPRSRQQNDPSQHDGDPRSHRISKSRRKTRSAPKSKYRSDLWTPNSLKKIVQSNLWTPTSRRELNFAKRRRQAEIGKIEDDHTEFFQRNGPKSLVFYSF